jgi:hypothetical protein
MCVKVPDGTGDVPGIWANIWWNTKAGRFIDVPIKDRDTRHLVVEPICSLKNYLLRIEGSPEPKIVRDIPLICFFLDSEYSVFA